MEVNRFEEIRDKAQRVAVAVKEALSTIISPKLPLESISTSLIADALEPELRRLEHGQGARPSLAEKRVMELQQFIAEALKAANEGNLLMVRAKLRVASSPSLAELKIIADALQPAAPPEQPQGSGDDCALYWGDRDDPHRCGLPADHDGKHVCGSIKGEHECGESIEPAGLADRGERQTEKEAFIRSVAYPANHPDSPLHVAADPAQGQPRPEYCRCTGHESHLKGSDGCRQANENNELPTLLEVLKLIADSTAVLNHLPVEHQMLICNAVKRAEAAPGQMSAREFLDKPENDLGFGKHRNNCGGTLIDGLCLRCCVETVMEAFARSQGEEKNG